MFREYYKELKRDLVDKKGEPLNCCSYVSNGSTQMHIESIGSNQTELTFNKGQVLFSYKTPVAAYTPSLGYIRTATKWSSTTTRHINKWLEGVNANEVDQAVLDNLVEG